jgi:hypothetical protein
VKINAKQRTILCIGGSVLAGLWGLTYILRGTTWLDQPPITCRTFLTKDLAHPSGKLKICITEVLMPFNPLSEDGDFQISFWNPTLKRRVDLTMRVSIPETPKMLTILWRVQKVQLYNQKGLQTKETTDRYTSSHLRYLPADVKTPLWLWLVQMARLHTEPQLDFETQIDGVIEKATRVGATITTAGLTAWKFFQAAGSEPQ